MIVTEVEIGGTKRGRIAYSFDDIALVPTRRTRNPEDVSTNWKIDAYDFSFPIMAAPMDSVVSPDVAINYGKLGGLAVLDLEGLWTRYEDPQSEFKKIANAKSASAVDLKCLTTARGDKEAAAITPADLICLILSLINSGFIGEA